MLSIINLNIDDIVDLLNDEKTIEEMQNSMKKNKPFSAFKIWHFISIFGKENLSEFRHFS